MGFSAEFSKWGPEVIGGVPGGQGGETVISLGSLVQSVVMSNGGVAGGVGEDDLEFAAFSEFGVYGDGGIE